MIRKHENSVSWKAGALAVAVHVALLAALLISFNWKAAHSVINATEVDLWDKLPTQSMPKVEPKPEPVVKEEPKPEPKPEPKVEEKKVEEQQKLEEQQAEIALEKKKQELAEKERQMAEKARLLEEKKLADKRKKDEERKKIAATMRDEDLQDKPKKDNSELKKLQQDALNEEKGDSDKKASAASAGEKDAAVAKIQEAIRSHINNAVCGEGNPTVRFSIELLPSGELIGNPKITKSSGSTACDDAVERAILTPRKLPMPTNPALISEFRNLNLTIRPNDN